MTRELRNEAGKILLACKTEGPKIILPDGMIDSAVFDIVRAALKKQGGKWKKASTSFSFNHDVTEELENAVNGLNETACEDDEVFTPVETVEVEEEKPFKTGKERRSLRYDYTATEVHDYALEMAEVAKKLQAAKEEKASVSAQYGAREKELNARLNKLSNQVADGWEIRDTECEVVYNSPGPGFKTIYRTDTNRKVAEERMDAHEFNLFTQAESED